MTEGSSLSSLPWELGVRVDRKSGMTETRRRGFDRFVASDSEVPNEIIVTFSSQVFFRVYEVNALSCSTPKSHAELFKLKSLNVLIIVILIDLGSFDFRK